MANNTLVWNRRNRPSGRGANRPQARSQAHRRRIRKETRPPPGIRLNAVKGTWLGRSGQRR
jgi:hypothetical protein